MMSVRRRRILVADSDRGRALALEQTLAMLGYSVAAVQESISNAAPSAAAAGPELVLASLDPGQPADTARAAEELRMRWAIPVIVLADTEMDANTDDGDAAAGGDSPGETPNFGELLGLSVRPGVERGPVHCLARPFTDRELRAHIELALCKADAATGIHDLDDRFFAVSIDMLCFLGFNGYFARLNPAWERTLGFTREELMSRPFIEFVHPDDRERTLRQNREVRGGGQALAFENRYICKDGSYRWLRWNAAGDPSQRVIYSVARDITAARQAELERETLLGELQTALAEVRTLQQILPMCSYCRKIRDDEDYWHTVEVYISRHTDTRFSHGICPHCMETIVEPQLDADDGA